MIKEVTVRKANEIYNEPLIIPVVIPDLDEIRKLAFNLHRKGEPVKARAFGWDIHYWPKGQLPSAFIIGESSIWSISFDWENGDDQEPIITEA